MAAPIIEFRSVNKWFGDSHVLRDVDLAIDAGSVMVICGPSGSGKSTLLRCINGLERAQSGTIEVLGRRVEAAALRSAEFRSSIGMVFQRFSLYPHMRVIDNLTLAPRHARKVDAARAEKDAMEMLERVGVEDKALSYPSQLSGGQQQRVAIARALVMRPRIMLFDEPTSALDPEMIQEVLDVIRSLARDGMTLLLVTHEMGFARNAASDVVFMDAGAIVERGSSAAFFSKPVSARAQLFLEHVLHH
jgi:polar amino acid transport system ATP-binding protein